MQFLRRSHQLKRVTSKWILAVFREAKSLTRWHTKAQRPAIDLMTRHLQRYHNIIFRLGSNHYQLHARLDRLWSSCHTQCETHADHVRQAHKPQNMFYTPATHTGNHRHSSCPEEQSSQESSEAPHWTRCRQPTSSTAIHIKGWKERYLLGQNHSLQIFGVIACIMLQNGT